ncbi:MAG: 1-deoxy-D-xylulose-5-phosphate reductoisomerase, partial [Gammaproteobacteria bacterium]|nr:1-deoxy-D-xylulose-5-phosphate reductoisomerase [Gammaproteobacteria bacterium]
QFAVHALTANTDVETMAKQCRQFAPTYAVMNDASAGEQLRHQLTDHQTEVLPPDQLTAVSSDNAADIVVAGIVGAAGLMPTLAAVEAGKRVLLANKESLVMAGDLFMSAVADHGAELLPVDSEHNAIFQCLPSGAVRSGLQDCGVEKILLTGSGGPFRDRDPKTLASVTPAEAIDHPNWDMGPKISVDSATMMNKGLELIEACWLFDVPPQDVEIVLHPQSIIHSMVAYNDGSVLAQMGQPDMRTPIANALGWPERIHSGVEPLDLVKVTQLNFEQADEKRFPCLRLARWAVHQGGTSMTILNAANEIAVEAFLNNQIAFTRIAELIENTLNRVESRHTDDLQEILLDDQRARKMTRQLINQI